MDDKKVTIRISDELFKQFRIALIQNGETAQAVLEKAVKNYLEEGNEMKNTYESNYQAKTVSGIIVTMPDSFDLQADYEAPRTYTAIRKGIWGNPDRKVRVTVDHEATGTCTTGTGDTVVKIC